MNINGTDYLLARVAHQNGGLLKWVGDRETRWLGDRLAALEIREPVFITGLARAGTTLLLETLSKADGVATHRYKDFPFVMAPYLWNRFADRFATTQAPVERPHKDRIKITAESPEAFEEPLWQHFFPFVHEPGRVHILGEDTRSPDFEQFFRDHLKKILLLRGGGRYLSKGNYNITRLEYLARMFPDARFIVPVRHPYTHVHSLVRQHRLFCDYARQDARVPEYLRAVGHYEFGPQRVPVTFSPAVGERIDEAWRAGDEYRGYALQWAQVYGYLDALRRKGGPVPERISVLRYEDLCADPAGSFQALLDFAHLAPSGALQEALRQVSLSPHKIADLDGDCRRNVWSEVSAVAAGFGYRESGEA